MESISWLQLFRLPCLFLSRGLPNYFKCCNDQLHTFYTLHEVYRPPFFCQKIQGVKNLFQGQKHLFQIWIYHPRHLSTSTGGHPNICNPIQRIQKSKLSILGLLIPSVLFYGVLIYYGLFSWF